MTNHRQRRSLAAWLNMMATGDFNALESIVASDAVFHSPVDLKPYEGRAVVCRVLRTAAAVFNDFEYHQKVSDGRCALLFFRARGGSEALRGVHVIRFNDAGEIEDVEKMVRPARAAVHLGDAIGERSGKAIKALREAVVNKRRPRRK